MRLSFIWAGRTRDAWLRSGIELYRKRIEYYAQVEIHEIRTAHAGRSPEETRQIEAQGILHSLPSRSHLVCLDEHGTEYDSKGLARRMGLLEERSVREIAWVIGGPYGLSRDVIDRADEILSLSRLTLTHDMARLILLEQIYRAFTIRAGLPYHHEEDDPIRPIQRK